MGSFHFSDRSLDGRLIGGAVPSRGHGRTIDAGTGGREDKGSLCVGHGCVPFLRGQIGDVCWIVELVEERLIFGVCRIFAAEEAGRMHVSVEERDQLTTVVTEPGRSRGYGSAGPAAHVGVA